MAVSLEIRGSLPLKRSFCIPHITPGLAASPWTAQVFWVVEAKV